MGSQGNKQLNRIRRRTLSGERQGSAFVLEGACLETREAPKLNTSSL